MQELQKVMVFLGHGFGHLNNKCRANSSHHPCHLDHNSRHHCHLDHTSSNSTTTTTTTTKTTSTTIPTWLADPTLQLLKISLITSEKLQLHTIQTSTNNNNNNNNNNVEDAAEMLRQSPESRQFLSLLQKCVPFLGILTKVTYDHGSGCILFIYYMFQDQKLYLSLVFIPPYTQPLSVWDVLWIVGVTDFVLKLVTIILKVSIAALPVFLLPYQKRGKCYLFLETTSQLYRSLAPIQPWLYYLLESHQGTDKVVGVFLSAAYMVSKGTDLVNRVKLWRGAFWKLLQNVNLGVSPNKDQLPTAGSQCPICHDEHETPVLLHCHHIFCEARIATWFDREQTCPLCNANVVDDPSWRDGATTYFTQLY
ncbi:hypothetical protein B7P43_G01282 [Cryptotermes secundus]|uniref:RING-type domain-containing protein n=1 Tax=Cryptotermes secundus TaxID=105785 RepID=A0A2J7RP44_9NEOP|nr:hypothetical protein B7P43_G01282 [Cryptotermes secundus]